ncbi:Probable RNA-directed DNA polymerase from transposon BS [Eumeta japonica]|uniref:Probable RNA-directed DNA polymerase from transposon BS n=1 Tax=Eumeta variegata TaxID=151549 RepID=A0A4C2ABJ6_EUMVA|nr:Probable RNA-directed DNA polymerase from transposon BS [Eumeta japonica]
MEEIKPSHKAFWAVTKALKTEGYTPIPPLKKPDNSVAIDDAEIAECLADSIETQCSRFLRTTSLISVASRKRFSKTSLEPKDDLAPVSLSEVQTLVKSLNTRKAPGLDAHSCPQQVLRLVEYVSEGFETERSTVAVFFDVAKAFDRVWHAANRHFTFRHERTHSTRRLIRAGVPQGSTLSLSAVLRVHKRYTATVVVWRPTRVIRGRYRAFTEIGIGAPDSPSSLQRAIDELGQWFRKWRIEVNPDKSAAIQFKYAPYSTRPPLTASGGQEGREPTRDGFLRHPMPRRLPPGVVHSACHAPSALACAVRPHSVKLSKSSDLSSDSSRPTK